MKSAFPPLSVPLLITDDRNYLQKYRYILKIRYIDE